MGGAAAVAVGKGDGAGYRAGAATAPANKTTASSRSAAAWRRRMDPPRAAGRRAPAGLAASYSGRTILSAVWLRRLARRPCWTSAPGMADARARLLAGRRPLCGPKDVGYLPCRMRIQRAQRIE